MTDKNKSITISPDSKVTPISKKPIKSINREVWGQTSVYDLIEQLTTLQNRYTIALEMSKPEMAKQIKRGIDELQNFITSCTNLKE